MMWHRRESSVTFLSQRTCAALTLDKVRRPVRGEERYILTLQLCCPDCLFARVKSIFTSVAQEEEERWRKRRRRCFEPADFSSFLPIKNVHTRERDVQVDNWESRKKRENDGSREWEARENGIPCFRIKDFSVRLSSLCFLFPTPATPAAAAVACYWC